MIPANPYVRAFFGGLLSALTVAGPLAGNGLTVEDWIAIAIAAITGSGLTAVSNGVEPTHPVGGTLNIYRGEHRAEGGHGAVELAVGVLVVVILVVVLLRLA